MMENDDDYFYNKDKNTKKRKKNEFEKELEDSMREGN